MMGEIMQFPETVEEFMQQYKITDTQQVYTNGTELVPIFRMKQWFEAHKQRWIPCSERMPEPGKILVTVGKTVTISNGAWLYRSLEGKTRVPANYGAGLTVTHWMPLPEPPEEEEQNER